MSEPAPKAQDASLTVQYESFHATFHFFKDGEFQCKRTQKECEEIFPHILWWKMTNPKIYKL